MLSPPILDNKHLSMPSVFSPAALLREARRQKNLPPFSAPEVCILDRDGDLVRRLRAAGSRFAQANPDLVQQAALALAGGTRTLVGPSWTTDAPFRETKGAIDAAAADGILCVEMEAAALHALARATGKAILCVAHVTNTMGQRDNDFEKGEADGTVDALLLARVVTGLAPGAL